MLKGNTPEERHPWLKDLTPAMRRLPSRLPGETPPWRKRYLAEEWLGRLIYFTPEEHARMLRAATLDS